VLDFLLGILLNAIYPLLNLMSTSMY
jgi:hypothetical protein